MITKRAVLLLVVMVCSVGPAVAQTQWLQHAGNPVIDHWDSWAVGVWPGAVVFDGTTYHMWFKGTFVWCISAGDVIGHATSSDGVNWNLDASPVMEVASSGGWATEYFELGAVIFDGELFHMWYSVQCWDDCPADNRMVVEYATSPDGRHWTEYAGNPVMVSGPPGSWDHGYLVPTTVLIEGGTFRMWYSGARTDTPRMIGGIGYAESADGVTWTKRPSPVLSPGGSRAAEWENSVLFPSVLFDGSLYHMWYTGGYPWTSYWADPEGSAATKMGYATSLDGIRWKKFSGNPIVDGGDHFIAQPVVLAFDSTFAMWYAHSPDNCTWDIAHATSDCCEVGGDRRIVTLPVD